MPTDPSLKGLISEALPGLIELRHDLHRHPELAFQERRTSGVVQRELAALNIEFKSGLGETGVIGLLPASDEGGREKPAVALRADMDALPIVEQTGKAYASCNTGVMHACGHDGHTAILIGAARVLSRVTRPRPVLLVFQPAEEGGGGAEKMCRQGALAGAKKGGLGPPAGRMFGLHGWPQLSLGKVASKPGALLAAVDDLEITIRGVQAHGAYPHLGADPILAASHVIVALQSIVSRTVSPNESAVVTIGAIHAGTANNIIPEEVKLIGTVRTLNAGVKKVVRERVHAIIEQTCVAMGCRAEVVYHDGYPVTMNDEEATREFFATARDALGEFRVEQVPCATMGGEDFAYYGEHAGSCFFFLGLKPEGSARYPSLHQPDFDFNDGAIATGVEMMCRLALA